MASKNALSKEQKVVPNPKVVDERYYVQRPNVMCEVWFGGKGILVSGIGFSRCELKDKWSESFGRTLARKRAVADAERDFYETLADFRYRTRMNEASDLVRSRYPIDIPFEEEYAKSAQSSVDEMLDELFDELFDEPIGIPIRIPYYEDNAATPEMMEEAARRNTSVRDHA